MTGNHELIDKYLDDNLTPEEHAAFEEALFDSEFADEFARRSRLNNDLEELLGEDNIGTMDLSAIIEADTSKSLKKTSRGRRKRTPTVRKVRRTPYQPGTKTQSRTALGFALVAAAAVVIGTVAIVLQRKPSKPVVFATLDNAIDAVSVKRNGSAVAVRLPMDLHVGDSIAVPENGSASLSYPDGTSIQCSSSTIVTIGHTKSGGLHFSLWDGEITADVQKQPTGCELVVTTDKARVTVVGTKFTVRTSSRNTRLDVHKGRVRFQNRLDESVTMVCAGQSCKAAISQPPPVVPPVQAKPPTPHEADPANERKMRITHFSLYKPNTDRPIPGYLRLVNGAVIKRSELPGGEIGIGVHTAPAVVGCVSFQILLNGKLQRAGIERYPPYFLTKDMTRQGDPNNVKGMEAKTGLYRVTATPHEGQHKRDLGPAGESATVEFRIVDD